MDIGFENNVSRNIFEPEENEEVLKVESFDEAVKYLSQYVWSTPFLT